jgi:tetratricopeptide (TPR) repeat protein
MIGRAAAFPLLLALACAHRAPLHPRAAEQIRRGYAHLEAGDPERAGVAFEHALAFDPEIPEALNGLGIVARSEGRLEEARAHFARAVWIDDSFAEGHANLGETLLALGRTDAARAEMEAALRIDPDLADARQNLARSLLREGLDRPGERERLWARARRDLLHLLESEPERAPAHHDLAFLDYAAGRFERAEQGYRRAADLAATAESLHGMCLSLVRLGRCEEGARACRRCLESWPEAERCRISLRGARACQTGGLAGGEPAASAPVPPPEPSGRGRGGPELGGTASRPRKQ